MAFGLEPAAYSDVATAAETLGFYALWLGDHVVTPLGDVSGFPYDPSGKPAYGHQTPLVDVLVVAAHIAARTTRLRIGTGVFILPLRNPLLVARGVATVQSLSAGRFLFGVGSGWRRDEFEAIGERFEKRGSRMDETISILRALWAGDPVAHAGEFYEFAELVLSPPIKPPRVLIGGTGERALRRAATLGDGWFGPNCDLPASLAARARIEHLRALAGRNGQFDYFVRLRAPLEMYAEAGFEDVVISLPSAGVADAATAVERIAAEVW